MRKVLVAALLAAMLVSPSVRADFIDLYADPYDVPVNKAPRLGKSSLLVIPVQIDFGAYAAVDMDRLHQFFEGVNTQQGDLTFGKFYGVASSGKFTPEVTVAPLIEYLGCPSMIHDSACTIDRGDVSSLSAGMDFVRDVFRRAHDEKGVVFTQFDQNGVGGAPDGVADGVMIVVNVPGIGIAFPIEYLNNGSNLAGGTGGALVLDGVRIPYCAIGGASVVGGVQHLEYVILHEFGHLLGFADLYYEHPTSGDLYPNWQGLHFSLMGDYDYTADVALPDAESRRALGWQQHVVVSGSQRITLQPAAAGGLAVKLGMMDGGRKEYFLAEVRGAAQGIDTGIKDAGGNPISGLALYHVDWSLGPKAATGEWPSRMLFCLDCNPFHPFIGNVQSSGNFSLISSGAADSFARPGVSDDAVLFTGGAISSIPSATALSSVNSYVATNYYDGTPSGVAISDIVVNDDNSVTATFTAPLVANPCSDVTCAAMEQCAPSGPMAGNCQAIAIAAPDAGSFSPPAAPANGCSSSGGSMAVLVGFALAGFAVRRRRTVR
jgi:M6 family metalloprotease-like protein